MFKKILTYFGYFFLFSLIAGYLIFSTILTKKGQDNLACKTIRVSILDSAQNRFVSKGEIIELLRIEGITVNESKIKHINPYILETILNNRNAIKRSEVSITRDGTLRVDIRQRRPILRIETSNGGFYMDETAYIFPLVKTFTSYVPIVSGEIPLKLMPGHRGKTKYNKEWADALREFGLYLDKEKFWNSMIEQIFIDEKGIIHLTPRIGEQDIIFGHLDNINYKFSKLDAFYQEVMPEEGWEKYRVIDLQYSNQIVCKIRDNKINKDLNI